MGEQLLPLQLFTLGPPEVRLGESLLSFPTRKTLALMIYLVVESGQQPREHLAALLWPESSAGRSRASLRNTLGRLQTVLRQANPLPYTAYLEVSQNSIGLNPAADITLDLKVVEQAYALARADRSSRALPDGEASLPVLKSAADCQRGEFLVGFSLGDAPTFDDWAAMQREVWNRRLSLVLDRLSEIQFANGEFDAAAETAARWIALDGLNEVAYRHKMRAHFAAGERGQALDTYEACFAALSAQLGVEPEPDTLALAERIRAQLSQRPATPPPHQADTAVAFLEKMFAGRTRERHALVKCYELAAQNQPQLAVMRGEAGIGKTRLARIFLNWAHAQGAESLQGSAFESGSHLPFQPLADALRMRLASEVLPDNILDEPWLSQLSQLLPEIRQRHPGLPAAPEQSPNPGSEASLALLFDPLVQCTLSLAKQAPLVLFIDDFQWTDIATLDFLHYAVRRWQESAARVMLLVNLRLEALHPMARIPQMGGVTGLIQWLARLERELSPVQIELETLGEDETVQMVQSILAPPAADFAQWAYDETRGQPFYLIETLKDLLERRILKPKRRAETQWSFAVNGEHELGQAARVPSTVKAVIRSRLNRLSPDAFNLLASAAVLELRLIFEHLCAVANLDEDMALPALDELISSRLLLETVQPGAAGAYILH